MTLELPSIDGRKYREIYAEMLARIRVHNPEWNNYNDSDPGITLLQLFAFMSENLLYRANLIPDRNRLKFLQLLDVPVQPPEAATGLVAVSNTKGPLETVVLPTNIELKAGKIPFRTRNGLDVLPVEAAVYTKQRHVDAGGELEEYQALYEGIRDQGTPIFYRTVLMAPPMDPANLPEVDLGHTDLVDNAVWIGLLARKAEEVAGAHEQLANRELSLGIYPAPGCDIECRLPPGNDRSTLEDAPLVFEIATGRIEGDDPVYRTLQASADTDILRRPGIVRLSIPPAAEFGRFTYEDPLIAGTGTHPPALEDTKDQERLVTWLRVRLAESSGGAGLSVRFHWLGINAARVSQRARASGELLGKGTGEADQRYNLIHSPVLADSVVLAVDGKAWTRVDDLYRAAPEVQVTDPRLPPGTATGDEAEAEVFRVDRASGTVRFGDGIHGARPAAGAVIRMDYDYGGGADGNVNIGAISKGASLPAGFRVANPLPTWGGAEGESAEQAERNIARYLQHRDRLVTRDDFASIALRTPGVDIGRVEILPLFDPLLEQTGSPGLVTVLAIPANDVANPRFPAPDQRTLEQVCAYLSPRRLITTELHVRGPKYVPMMISVGIEVAPGHEVPSVREAVSAGLYDFLSPRNGGREGHGWPLDKPVVARELWAEAARVEGVAYVNELLLGDEDGDDFEEIKLAGLEMPKLLLVEARQGEAANLKELLGIRGGGTVGGGAAGGGEDPGTEEGTRILPVPVVPATC